jgi:hypothetical protein
MFDYIDIISIILWIILVILLVFLCFFIPMKRNNKIIEIQIRRVLISKKV